MTKRQFICSKCSHDDADVRYSYNINIPEDYLYCKCRRCEYKWREKPSDSGRLDKEQSSQK